jgi:hypothetical protein
MDSLFQSVARVTRCVLLTAMLLALAARVLAAESAAEVETQVKAAFIPRLASFVTWPAASLGASNAPLVIGIFGPDPFGPRFDESLKAERVHGHPVAIKRFSDALPTGEVHLLFISVSATSRLAEVQRSLGNRPVLTLSDSSGFAEAGGMIGFTKVGGKVRFEINLAAAEAAGLQVSSRLLQVSKVMRGKEKP